MAFIPTTKKEMKDLGIEQFDYIYITGDSYVDHPSFGVAIITRLIQSLGFTVAVISQPRWKTNEDFTKFGAPKYAFLASSGNIDSMVAHYSVAKKRRTRDEYTVAGKMGMRPDRAVIVYGNILKELYPDTPLLIGGLEASLRRFAHYDYWDDCVRPSILVDSKADLLMFGMGELQITEIVNRFAKGETVETMTDIDGTCYLTEPVNTPLGAVQCPDFHIVSTDKKSYAKATRIQMDEQDETVGKTVIQRHGKMMLVQNPPMRALNQSELDRVYSLPYERMYHPSYESQGGVPGIQEVEFSIAHNRGCFGACNFCSLAFHQGRKITCRSEKSVLIEAEKLVQNPRFKGYIHDVGGPTANFRHPSCDKQEKLGLCKGGKKCLAPTCKALKVDHSEYLTMLRKLREIKGIKKVFIRSGIRYDYLIEDQNEEFFDELVEHHVSGQLKVAPEHCSANVLDMMGKPHIETYKKFQEKFYEKTKKAGKEQYLVPYLMSSHPGSTLNDAIELSIFLKEEGLRPEQVQDFYPTPGTVSTCMYYTGLNPYTMKEVYVPVESEDKAMQRALLQYFDPKNKNLVLKALKIAKRRDLIGTGKGCLVNEEVKKSTSYNRNTPKSGAKKGQGLRDCDNKKFKRTVTNKNDRRRGKVGGKKKK